MNWEEMSDDQINLKVLEQQFGPLGDDKDIVRIWQQGKFQPCNSWSDAGPIIERNGISLRKRYDGDWRAENEWGISHHHDNDNPLRAAMIVFLMMRVEGEV